MNSAGLMFLVSMIYLTLLLSFVISLIDFGYAPSLIGKTFRRWGKFLLLLGALGVIVVVLTVVQGWVV